MSLHKKSFLLNCSSSDPTSPPRDVEANSRDGCAIENANQIIFNVLQYQPALATSLCLSGPLIERVSHYKLLGVFISSDLSWNMHCEYVLARANTCLYAWRVEMRCGLAGFGSRILQPCKISY